MLLKITLIYGLAIFTGVLASGLSLIILMPTASIVQKYKFLKLPYGLFTGLLGGLIGFSAGALILNWFNIKLTFWLILFYAVCILLNDKRRFNRPDADKKLEWGWLLGEIFGLILGALIFGLF